MDDLRSTAFHEAGHAVIAVLEKLSVVRVSIEPCGEMLGHTTIDCFHLNDDYREARGLGQIAPAEWEIMRLGWERWRMEANARTVLAGEIAERLFHPGRPTSIGAGRDVHRFSLWLVELSLDRDERELQAQLLRMQTERQLRTYWRAVEQVAALLLERHTIGGNELVEAIEPVRRCV